MPSMVEGREIEGTVKIPGRGAVQAVLPRLVVECARSRRSRRTCIGRRRQKGEFRAASAGPYVACSRSESTSGVVRCPWRLSVALGLACGYPKINFASDGGENDAKADWRCIVAAEVVLAAFYFFPSDESSLETSRTTKLQC